VELEKVNLTGAPETTLITLYAKAMESRQKNSVLHDRLAYEALQRVDYDFKKLRVRRSDVSSAAVRAKAYDVWIERFLDRFPECTVLHLGCGLDTRVYRVNPPDTVRWYEIDFPDVIDLRLRLFPERPGVEYLSCSVTDPRLLDEIYGDTPVLVVAEGLTPYLRASEGVAMLRRITEHFPAGEMVFDGYGKAGVWFLQRYGPVKASGAQLDWSIDDPLVLERQVPGLVFDSEWWYPSLPEIERQYSWPYREFLQMLFRIKLIRRMGRGLRYHFGKL
jgi:O-methyltransferase